MQRYYLFLIILLNMQSPLFAQKKMSYLALGDSYTIGESVSVYENFPYQTVHLLRKNGMALHAPEIVAKTGWTTDELLKGMEQTPLLQEYDFVSLLIGVNNQYRGRPVETFSIEFEQLLMKAIVLAGGKKEHVFVISIPDWGATPFAEGRDRSKIAKEIDAFNLAKKSITIKNGIQFLEITEGSRAALNDTGLVAKDKLHPSAKEYAKWAQQLANAIRVSIRP